MHALEIYATLPYLFLGRDEESKEVPDDSSSCLVFKLSQDFSVVFNPQTLPGV